MESKQEIQNAYENKSFPEISYFILNLWNLYLSKDKKNYKQPYTYTSYGTSDFQNKTKELKDKNQLND